MKESRIQGILILAFPIVLSIGIFLIPVVPDYADHALAALGVEKMVRWFLGHILAAVGFGLSPLSVSAIKSYLKGRSHVLPIFISPAIAIGAGLYAAGLGADGIGPIAVRDSGASPTLFFDGSGWWVSGTFMVAIAFFAVGLISLVVHANKSGMVTGIWRYVILISALLFVSIPAIPSGWALYGEAIAAYGVFFPLGLTIWRS